MSKENVIRFSATVFQIRTLVDGGMNVTLALSDKDIKQVSQLLECRKMGAVLEVAAVPVKQVKQEEKKSGTIKRKQRYPYRAK
jgi:hypothetical protein